MNNENSISLTDFEFVCIIIGSIIDFSLMVLPNTAVTYAQQDGWIGILIGAIYPLYVVIIGSIIIKKHPNSSIMEISRKYLGKVFGTALNILFSLQFLYYVPMVLGHGVNMLTTFAVWFMSANRIVVIIGIIVIYGTTRGLKVLAKINIFGFIGICIIVFFTLISFKYGSILNLQPVFNSDLSSLLKAGVNSSFAYANMELILVIHPFVKNKKNITKLALTSTAIIAFFYTWCVFSTTLYLGPDIVKKSPWAFFFMTESIRVPVINNFRIVLMFIWPIIVYKSICTELYMGTNVLSNITGMEYKKWCYYLVPVLFIMPFFFRNEVQRMAIADLLTPGVTIFNLVYITIIALLVLIKGNRAQGKS